MLQATNIRKNDEYLILSMFNYFPKIKKIYTSL